MLNSISGENQVNCTSFCEQDRLQLKNSLQIQLKEFRNCSIQILHFS